VAGPVRVAKDTVVNSGRDLTEGIRYGVLGDEAETRVNALATDSIVTQIWFLVDYRDVDLWI
jgi:hypothetical protein